MPESIVKAMAGVIVLASFDSAYYEKYAWRETGTATANAPNATQQQVDNAKSVLEAAIQVFESKKISADVNGKDGITVGDLAIVAAAYGKQEGQPGWNAKADVNHDGKVDIEDLAIVAKAILQ